MIWDGTWDGVAIIVWNWEWNLEEKWVGSEGFFCNYIAGMLDRTSKNLEYSCEESYIEEDLEGNFISNFPFLSALILIASTNFQVFIFCIKCNQNNFIFI